MRPHVLGLQPAFLLAGLYALCKFVHKTERRLCFLIVLHIHNGVSAAPVFRQKDRSARGHMMQHLAVITQIGNRFDVRQLYPPLSAYRIRYSVVKYNCEFTAKFIACNKREENPMLTSEFSNIYEAKIRGTVYTITSECPEDTADDIL